MPTLVACYMADKAGRTFELIKSEQTNGVRTTAKLHCREMCFDFEHEQGTVRDTAVDVPVPLVESGECLTVHPYLLSTISQSSKQKYCNIG